ncbi:hypothetical protein HanRHA438_Chr17g0835811 [Helianthus annuus]|nr:hypothetical protein HanRHA438_Chr17g0835811 [Helianthus annuus]
MHKEWAAFEASKKEANEEKAKVALLRAKLKADQARFESEQKTEEWSAAWWKRKAEAKAALLSEERKHWREICEKDNNEKMGLRNNINNLKVEIEKLKKEKIKAEAARDEARSHRERSEQRELERVEKAETSHCLAETEGKLEDSETARVTAESLLVQPLRDDMIWMKHHGIINVANSVLNSIDLDQTVANLMVTARNDGYTQGYTECTKHVNNALKVDLNDRRSATYGVDTGTAHAAAKTEYKNLRLPVMDGGCCT